MTTTSDFITALFSEVDEQMGAIPTHPEAHLWPSEVVTLGLLHALKGVGNRPFYRWLTRDYRALFPHLPERTRLFRLFKTHHNWTGVTGRARKSHAASGNSITSSVSLGSTSARYGYNRWVSCSMRYRMKSSQSPLR